MTSEFLDTKMTLCDRTDFKQKRYIKKWNLVDLM